MWRKCVYPGCAVTEHNAKMCWEDPKNAKLRPPDWKAMIGKETGLLTFEIII